MALQVDGPVHFSYNSHEPVGSTCLKHHTLRLLGWKVVSVPFYEWERLQQGRGQVQGMTQVIPTLAGNRGLGLDTN